MAETKKMSLTMQIIIAMVAGAILGVGLNQLAKDAAFIETWVVGGIFHVIGTTFIASLKMMVVPLVFVSLVGGVTALGDVKSLGRIGVKVVVLYLFTTAVAITIALSVATLFSPGGNFKQGESVTTYEAKEAPSLVEVLIDMIPTNPFKSMAEGNMLQIIAFALLVGVALTMVGEKGKQVISLFASLDAVVMTMVNIVMKLAPIGVFCLIAKTFATQGIDIFLPLMSYFVVVVGALFIHAIVTFSCLLKLVARLNPIVFFRKMRSTAVFAFSTASSNATIPANLNAVEHKLGVKQSVAAFTVPLGATINMDGTAIMQGVATVFIANVYGIDLGLTDYLSVIMIATLASIGTAGVPGVGLIMLAMVLGQVGLPIEGIGLIIGVDRLLDMLRTAVNVMGDATVSCIVAKSEKSLDLERYNQQDVPEL
jgi:Na+/H+-dicarboxylate symporter